MPGSIISKPPADMVMPFEPQVIFSLFVHIPMAIFLFKAFESLAKNRDPIPLYFLVGGAISVLFEPIVDVFGLCYFPAAGQLRGGFIAFHNRMTPAFMPAVYSWFVGGQGYWFYSALQNGKVTKSRLWALYPALWLINAVLELPGLLLGVYTYYGYQPFQVFGFPLWWPCVNSIMPLAAGFAAHVLQPHFSDTGLMSIIAIVPMADGMINAGLAWPVWISLGSDWGYFYTYPAALATFTLSTLTIWAMTTQLPQTLSASSNKDIVVKKRRNGADL